MKCELCEKRPAGYAINATLGTIKVWLEVCESCDDIIGEANLEKFYRDMPLTDGRLVGEVNDD